MVRQGPWCTNQAVWWKSDIFCSTFVNRLPSYPRLPQVQGASRVWTLEGSRVSSQLSAAGIKRTALADHVLFNSRRLDSGGLDLSYSCWSMSAAYSYSAVLGLPDHELADFCASVFNQCHRFVWNDSCWDLLDRVSSMDISCSQCFYLLSFFARFVALFAQQRLVRMLAAKTFCSVPILLC